MKTRHFLFAALTLLAAACSKEGVELSPQAQALLGRKVDFNASMAAPFATKATYRHNGAFNEGDIMTIYRQYSSDYGRTFDSGSEAFRVYELKTKYATGTDLALETDWLPRKGETGFNPPSEYITQTEADSLTWDNGKTVRFRAWSRSNVANAIVNSTGDGTRFYPDFCVAEWVTVSGPTMAIPMELKHLGCRIGFTTKAGNELRRAEICTDWKDYMWEDNADTAEHDEADTEHGKAEAVAREQAEAVKAVYDRMCMPAGVDMEHALLTSMTQALYDSQPNFAKIHEKTEDDGIVKYDTKTPDQIASEVKRPEFASNDGRLYMISVPYDMSTGGRRGEAIVLPSYTRFKIWLYDVNDGDKAATHDEESNYHIFSLSDVKNKEGEGAVTLFPDGMELLAGVSYLFSVGYHYDNFTLTPADSFSWEEQEAENGDGASETVTPGSAGDYQWWKDAIKEAIPKNISQSFNPVFHIDTREEFLELIKLVNGTATDKTSGLTHMLDPTRTFDKDHPAQRTDYRWYPSEYIHDGKVMNQHKADSVTHERAIAQGYIFYEHYYPANADQAAYSQEDYLRGPYSFFDENLNAHFTIELDGDLDLADWKLTAIGSTAAHPFRGALNGNGHLLKNVYMDGGALFAYGKDMAVRNLHVQSVHNFQLIGTSEAQDEKTGYGAYVAGVSIQAPCSGNPIATTLTGTSYVVGCIYEGKAGGALVGTADKLSMYGNMMAASGLASGTGALLGSYPTGSAAYFAPQTAKKLSWSAFMVNYYDKTLSENTHAVGAVIDNYRPQEYIRGAESHILKAKNDNLLADDVPWEKLVEKGNDLMLEGYYGLAPWKAMNYAIWKYNKDLAGSHTCDMHYENSSTGYVHRYPVLVSGGPDNNYEAWNVLEQNN